MGWELRANGRRYLYRNRRVNGRPVKEYLGADDDFGSVQADDLRLLQKREAKVRRLTRAIAEQPRQRIAGVLAAVDAANRPLRAIADALLLAAGFRRHHRGEWRMNRTLKKLAKQIAGMKAELEKPRPLVRFEAPAGDAEAVEVYAQARAGDAAAQKRVGELIRQRGWADWVGDIAQRSTRVLVSAAATGDPVWAAAIEEKVKELNADLLGPNPTVLERLLVRRVVNGWVAVHALELELSLRPPANPTSRAYLEASIGRAQKRMTQAVGELARLRRLQAPLVVAKLHLPLVGQPPANAPALPPAGG